MPKVMVNGEWTDSYIVSFCSLTLSNMEQPADHQPSNQ